MDKQAEILLAYHIGGPLDGIFTGLLWACPTLAVDLDDQLQVYRRIGYNGKTPVYLYSPLEMAPAEYELQ